MMMMVAWRSVVRGVGQWHGVGVKESPTWMMKRLMGAASEYKIGLIPSKMPPCGAAVADIVALVLCETWRLRLRDRLQIRIEAVSQHQTGKVEMKEKEHARILCGSSRLQRQTTTATCRQSPRPTRRG